jgi:hypothetical protein
MRKYAAEIVDIVMWLVAAMFTATFLVFGLIPWANMQPFVSTPWIYMGCVVGVVGHIAPSLQIIIRGK